MRRTFARALALSLLLSSRPGWGLELLPYLEGTRFDLVDGRPLLDPQGELSLTPVRPARWRALRDEVLGIPLGLRGARGTYRLQVEGLAGLRPRLFAAQPVHVATPSRSERIFGMGPGHYPDVLVPSSTVSVEESAPALLWLDVFVPRTATAGVHRGRLVVSGPQQASLELVVEVLPLALPERDVARLGAVSFGSLLLRAKRSPARFLEWMQLLQAHALTPELMRITPPRSSSAAVDWDRWAARVEPFLSGRAYREEQGYLGPRAGRPISRFVMPHCEWWPSSPDASGWLPADGARWSATLAEWEHVVEARGWFADTEWILFINALDEPKAAEQLRALARYEPLLAAAELRARERVHFRVDGVLGARVPGWTDRRKVAELGGVVDLWNLHGAPDTAPLELLAERRPGEGVLFYASSSGGEPAIPPLAVDAPAVGARAWGWIVARYDLAGALNWELDVAAGCVRDPLCSEGRSLNLDATLVYRGEEVGRAVDEPIPSMRLKLLRRGAQDAALLALLAERDPAAARALAERVIPRALGDGALLSTGRGRWSYDPAVYAAAREELLDRLSGRTVARRPGVGLWLQVAGALLLILVILAWQRRRAR